MRVTVAEPTTSNAPTAWRKARCKLRSCRKTGRQSERRARKRVSNTAGGSRLYLYQDLCPSSSATNQKCPNSSLSQNATAESQMCHLYINQLVLSRGAERTVAPAFVLSFLIAFLT